MRNIHSLVLRGAIGGSVLTLVLCLALGAGANPGAAGTPTPASQPLAAAAAPAAAADCQVSERFPESIRQWCGLITQYAEQHGLAPDLIAALIWQESGGNALAYSRSGAVGLMQVMPRDGLAASFRCVNGPCFADRPTIAELQEAEFNIAYGTTMLAGLANRFGDLREALKAYGPMDVGYYYADKVLKLYETYGG